MASFTAMLIGAIATGASAQTQGIPSLLADGDGQTLWVSAERVVEEGPELLRGLDDPLRFSVAWLLRALVDPGAFQHPPPGRSDCLQYLEAVGLTGTAA